MNKESKYSYKRLEDQHLPDVQYIFLKAFNKKVSLEYLKNKYDTSLIGIKYICTIAFDEDKPIAFYGAIPQKFSSKSSHFFAAHACDSFTLPQYQKQGLHYNLALKAYKIMQENGIKFVYAFHSENTYYSTKKLGWKEHVRMNRFHISIHTFPLAKVMSKLNLQRKYDKIIKYYLRKHEDKNCAIEASFKNRIGNIYNNNFLTYKNSFNRHYLVKLHNCIFWVKIQSVMHVGFFSISSYYDFKKAIKSLKKTAFIAGVNEILFQVSPDSEMNNVLQSIYKPKESWLIGYLSFDESININDFEFTYADLDTF